MGESSSFRNHIQPERTGISISDWFKTASLCYISHDLGHFLDSPFLSPEVKAPAIESAFLLVEEIGLVYLTKQQPFIPRGEVTG